MEEILVAILVFILVGAAIAAVCTLWDFFAETPKQLKRIADALEWRNRNGK